MKMPIKIIFTYGHNPVSAMIRDVTGEPISHTGIQIGDTVIHSNFLGLHLQSSESFFSSTILFDSVSLEVDDVDFYHRLGELRANYKGYDFKALIFLGLRYLLPKSWTPKVNIWQVTNQYICTELVSFLLDGEADSMITPYQMYLKLKEKEAKQ